MYGRSWKAVDLKRPALSLPPQVARPEDGSHPFGAGCGALKSVSWNNRPPGATKTAAHHRAHRGRYPSTSPQTPRPASWQASSLWLGFSVHEWGTAVAIQGWFGVLPSLPPATNSGLFMDETRLGTGHICCRQEKEGTSDSQSRQRASDLRSDEPRHIHRLNPGERV